MFRLSSPLLAILLAPALAFAQQPDDVAKLEKQRCPKPTNCAIVFSFGYGGDELPKDDAAFDKLLGIIKEGGFNVVHCTFTDQRLELCKKHGVQMMVDLLAGEHHVYKSPDKAEAVCKKLRDNPHVWGYNIWNDSIRSTHPGRKRDVNNVRQWDPTHPAFIGTYRVDGMKHVTNADLIGYYDYHWTRKREYYFPHLLAFSNWARERDAWWGSWLEARPGQPGQGNFNRCLYTANTSIACGQKVLLWFLGVHLLDRNSFAWTETGRDIIKVNKAIGPLGKELARLGNPAAIYSTAITRTMNNDPLPDDKKEAMPPGLEKHGFPKEFFLQPAGGEFVLGAYKNAKGRDLAFVANHNAYAEQQVVLKTVPLPARLFDRAKGEWRTLEGKDGAIRFTLAPGSGELLQFGSVD